MNVERKKKFLRWSAHTSLGPTKCKVMIFNTRREYDGKPRLSVERDDYLDVLKVVKLLGIIVSSDLKGSNNSVFICKKGYARLWMLRRLKKLGN